MRRKNFGPIMLKLKSDLLIDSITVGGKVITKRPNLFDFRSPRRYQMAEEAVMRGLVEDIDNVFGLRPLVEIEEVVEEVVEEVAPEVVEEVVEEAAPEVVEEAAPEVVEEAAPEVVEEAAPEIVEEVVEEKAEPADNFFCPVEDCPRHTDGYSREGDLKRHIKKEHPELV